MSRETITVKCYPSVEAVNKKTKEKGAFGWELINNESVETSDAYYQMLTFTRDTSIVTPQLRQLNEEFDLLEEMYKKDDYTQMGKIVHNYQNKSYYQEKSEDLEEVEEVEIPKIRNEKRVRKPLIGLIIFAVLSVVYIILSITNPNPAMIFFYDSFWHCRFNLYGCFSSRIKTRRRIKRRGSASSNEKISRLSRAA